MEYILGILVFSMLIISVVSGRFYSSRIEKKRTFVDLIPIEEPKSIEEEQEERTLEDGLIRCLTKMHATPRVLAVLCISTVPLTIEEIHAKINPEDVGISVRAVRTTLRILMNGPFVSMSTDHPDAERYYIVPLGKDLFNAMMTRGQKLVS